MAQSIDFCQYCNDMIDAAEAGVCYPCFYKQREGKMTHNEVEMIKYEEDCPTCLDIGCKFCKIDNTKEEVEDERQREY